MTGAWSKTWLAALTVALILVGPTDARADGWFAGFLGRAFGGAAGVGLGDAVKTRDTATYGFNLGDMNRGIFGADLDFGHTPNFFDSENGVEKSGVMTIMGGLVVGVPLGGTTGAGVRPYGLFGLGLVRRNIEFLEVFDKVTQNDFGYDVGGGLMVFFNDVVGIRGEYRHFQNFKKVNGEQFDFDRATAAFLLRF